MLCRCCFRSSLPLLLPVAAAAASSPSPPLLLLQAVDRIENRNTSKNFWLHVAFQAVHGGAHREATDTCDLLPVDGESNSAVDGFRDAKYGSALHSLDHGINNITAALKDKQMWENTIFWLSAGPTVFTVFPCTFTPLFLQALKHDRLKQITAETTLLEKPATTLWSAGNA